MGAEGRAFGCFKNYRLKFAFFWCLLVPLGPPSHSPNKIRPRKLAIPLGVWETECRAIAGSFAGCPSLVSGLWVSP